MILIKEMCEAKLFWKKKKKQQVVAYILNANANIHML